MEKENGKKRAVARRKYQDDVRALVEFCRRRDRRVIRRKLQLAKEKEARLANVACTGEQGTRGRLYGLCTIFLFLMLYSTVVLIC